MYKVLQVFTALCFISVSISYSQITQTKWQLGFYGGYSLPTADLEGTFPDTLGAGNKLDFTTARTLLTKSGYNFGAHIKMAVDTTGNAKLTGGMGYSQFTGSKDYVLSQGESRNYKSKVSIFTILAGAEYSLSPGKRVNPYFGFSLAANFFGGDIKAAGDTSFVIDRTQETRLGVIADLGMSISVSKSIGVLVGVKYAAANLFFKSYESQPNTNTNTDDEGEPVSAFFELPLNDAAFGGNDSKSFTYFQFYAGLSINLGQPLK